jgi:hypothetical protein
MQSVKLAAGKRVHSVCAVSCKRMLDNADLLDQAPVSPRTLTSEFDAAQATRI